MRIIGGKYKSRALKAPKGDSTRPTSSRMREAVFNILMHQIEGERFLDLFAGSGAMGLEALSRGASFAAFVEENKGAARTIEENIATLAVRNQTMLLVGDCLKQLYRLEKMERPFSIIYIDPPYGAPIVLEVLKLIDRSSILEVGGILLLEESNRFEVPDLETLSLKKSRSVGRSTLYELSKSQVASDR